VRGSFATKVKAYQGYDILNYIFKDKVYSYLADILNLLNPYKG